MSAAGGASADPPEWLDTASTIAAAPALDVTNTTIADIGQFVNLYYWQISPLLEVSMAHEDIPDVQTNKSDPHVQGH